jgi:hypothetical protein
MLLPGESKAELDQLRSEMMTSYAPVGNSRILPSRQACLE